jgi:transposase
MKQDAPEIIEVTREQLDIIFQQAQTRMLEPEELKLLQAICSIYFFVLAQLTQTKVTLDRLRKMLFGAKTEKSDQLFPQDQESTPAEETNKPLDAGETEDPSNQKKKRRGHGRHGAADYTGATKIRVPLEALQAGDACPECARGTLYETPSPAVIVRLTGQAPVGATVFELERVRCHLCGKVFTATLPEEAGTSKYDESVGTVIALLKYGSGLPFHRLQRLQDSLGIPLASSTQWDLVHSKAKCLQPVLEELIRQAAQGDVVHNDDTNNKILAFMGKRAQKARELAAARDPTESSAPSPLPKPSEPPGDKLPASGHGPSDNKKDSDRKGTFTSGIVSRREGRDIALFFTGRHHCGENLQDVLLRRAEELSAPIQMCDGLDRNLPAELETIVANCLAHGRRKFVDVVKYFEEKCRHVIEALKVIYQNDAKARKEKMSPEARLAFHQVHSKPTMDLLQTWLQQQLDDRLVEPNSGLGQAITYMLNRWEQLTLFLRKPGAPLDNNICERALKKSILHRKNSLFFLSQNGADVSDLFMSLIYTCELNKVNPFDYLNELERHAEAMAADPAAWMPWNYRETLEGVASAKVPSTA